MPAPRPFIGEKDLHLIGLILDQVDDTVLEKMAFSLRDRVRADAMFDDINTYLNEKLGLNWNDMDAEA